MVSIGNYLVGSFRCNTEQSESRDCPGTKDDFFGNTDHSRNVEGCSKPVCDMDAMHAYGSHMDYEGILRGMNHSEGVALPVE